MTTDPFIALCSEATGLCSQMLLGVGGQSVMGNDRCRVHKAIGDIADLVVKYVEMQKNKPKQENATP